MAILYILWSFWYIFFIFGMLCHEKSGNPARYVTYLAFVSKHNLFVFYYSVAFPLLRYEGMKNFAFWCIDSDSSSATGLPDGIFSKIPLWVNFGESCDGKRFYGHLVHFTTIWYILWPFGLFYNYIFGKFYGHLV
jgi:hypothetical protein